MTKTEWENAVDPGPMLEFLRDRIDEHQLRFFAVACCRRVERLLLDVRSRRSVEVAERYARNEASPTALELAALAAKDAYEAAKAQTFVASASEMRDLIAEGGALIAEGAAQAAYIVADGHFALSSAAAVAYCAAEAACGLKPPNSESAMQAGLLRQIIAYPGSVG
jgi:hypothetical protein